MASGTQQHGTCQQASQQWRSSQELHADLQTKRMKLGLACVLKPQRIPQMIHFLKQGYTYYSEDTPPYLLKQSHSLGTKYSTIEAICIQTTTFFQVYYCAGMELLKKSLSHYSIILGHVLWYLQQYSLCLEFLCLYVIFCVSICIIIKSLQKLGLSRSYLKPTGLNVKPVINDIPNQDNIKTFPLKPGIRQVCPVFLYLFHTFLEVLSTAAGQEKNIKEARSRKRVSKMILYFKDPQI